MKIQFTMLVEESKQLIALGTVKHPKVKKALENGKIILKGGTTVSRISEILLKKPMRISGRITARGTVTALNYSKEPHTLIIENGKWENIDEELSKKIKELGLDDVIICGANAFDHNGKAALIVGSTRGGSRLSFSSWYTEGASIIIPVGIEKMIPGDIDEIINKCSRKGKNCLTGASVGLLPIYGEIITEIEAIKNLADVECQAIGSGGLGEANGSVTLEVWGEDKEVSEILSIIMKIKDEKKYISGNKESLIECHAICKSCSRHIGCGYKNEALKEIKKRRPKTNPL